MNIQDTPCLFMKTALTNMNKLDMDSTHNPVVTVTEDDKMTVKPFRGNAWDYVTTDSLNAQLSPTLRKLARSVIELEKRVDEDEKEFDNLSKQVKKTTEAVLEMAKGLPEELTKIILTEVSKRLHDPSEEFFIGERNIRGIREIVDGVLEEKDTEQKQKSDTDERFNRLRQDMESNIEAKVTQDFKNRDDNHEKKIEGVEKALKTIASKVDQLVHKMDDIADEIQTVKKDVDVNRRDLHENDEETDGNTWRGWVSLVLSILATLLLALMKFFGGGPAAEGGGTNIVRLKP